MYDARNRHSAYRRAFPLLVALVAIAGCSGDRLVGTWEGTYDGEKHELKFTGSGRLLRSTDFVGGRSGWTSWRATDERGKKVFVTAGGEELMVTFEAKDKIRVFRKTAGVSIDMRRTKVETEEEQDSRSYAMAYLLLILAVTFGLVVVCRPSGRADS